MLILGIETSCDETGLALYQGESDQAAGRLLGEVLYSQIELHNEYGGVVPELASRDHIAKLLPLLHTLLEQTGQSLTDLDAIAYTQGPGLMGALLTGVATALTLAEVLAIPAIGVHHMEGHLLAALLSDETQAAFPALALLVSGGHTLLLHAHALGRYQVLGESIDDAAGEAFDKTAQLLGLPYPGGAALAHLAEQGDPDRYTFPRPLLKKPGLDFSFSGLKTHVLNKVMQAQKTASLDEQHRADIARAFEDAVVDVLVKKCARAVQQTGIHRLIVAGGVGANQRLRKALSRHPEIEPVYPPPRFCTDNGAMIAYAGYLRWQQSPVSQNHRDLEAGNLTDTASILARPRWSLETLV